MFRSKRSNTFPSTPQSSLSSGNASIQIAQTVEDNYYSEFNEDEIIDLQAPQKNDSDELTIESMSAVIAAAVQLSSAGGQPSSLSLGSASILQPFSKLEKKQRRFSLFSWKKPAQTSTSPVSPTTPSTPGLEHSHSLESCISSNAEEEEEDAHTPRNSSSSAVIVDDGRDELVYRGIQIKEIKTTLKPLVISDEVRNPMPQVKLERPGFARINY